MKIIINEDKLREYMEKNNIKTYRQLCRECGISYWSFCTSKSKRYTLSSAMFWLIANRLNCHIEELQIPEYK